jgi:putative membrane-bound dehydrogenase-like protein
MRASIVAVAVLMAACVGVVRADSGVLPLGDDGKALNLDFETGTLKDWKADGNAFDGQPVKGDAVNHRRPDMHSRHAGQYWVGTFEVEKDGPRGTLTSVPFKVTHPWASFLVGGGTEDESVDIVLADTNELFFHATGDNREDMERVAVDLRKIEGKRVYLRVVDEHSFAWGHVNFDDFKFHTEEPVVPKRLALTPDVSKYAGLTPDEAAKAMTLPPGFKSTMFAGEPDVNQPVGFCMDDRGRLWVAEAWTYPIRAKEGAGKDRIIIYEDTDGDGKADKRTIFAEHLNLVSGIEVGFGGVFVGAAPYMLFIPDKNHDDKPDGPPEVLLDGFAYQDTHETLNAFNWGPDGWLYGCHGVFTHSLVGKPGTPKEQRVPMNAAVWRYHPTKKVFEVFAEGSSNPWGVDFNDHGQAFITACVIPHLYHVIEGARYQRQAGAHFNPYVYRDISTIADHVHWLGDAGPHAGNNKSASAGGGHAHCGAMVYLGNSWPKEYRDSLFMANIHGNRLNNDRLEPKGSGYVGTHAPDPVLMNDKWSRLINFKYGPDGSVYMIDWYDKQACHNPNGEIWDRTNGRIYKLIYNDQPAVTVDLAKKSNSQLVELLVHPNDWYGRHARRLLQERNAGAEVAEGLKKILSNPDATRRLRGLWAMHCTGVLTPDVVQQTLKDADPYVRAWTVQLVAQGFGPMNLTGPFNVKKGEGEAVGQYASTLAELAQSDPSPIVRLYVASALQRMAPGQRWAALEQLVAHGEDAGDHNLPLMYWYAAEAAVGEDVARGVELAKKSQIPLLRELIARRVAAVATAGAKGDVAKVDVKPLETLAALLAGTGDAEFQANVLNGMADSLNGWPRLPAPAGWAAVYEKLSGSTNEVIRARTQELSVMFGDERALAALRKTVTDTAASAGERKNAIEALVAAKDAKLPPLLLQLIGDPPVRSAALRGLAAFDAPETPGVILKAYPTFGTEVKVEALNALAARVEYARALKDAVDSGVVPKADVTAATLRQLATLESDEIKKWLAGTFGAVRSTPQEKQREIERLATQLGRRGYVDRADVNHGRALFAKTCMQCHTLFDTGGKVGPDLTGSNRADVNYVLTNVLDPSAVIGKDYLMSVIRLKDQRVISGIVKSDDGNTLKVQTESELLTIPKSNVVRQKQQEISMMPEGLLAAMKFEDVRDLVGYLRSPKQVPLLATTQNVNSFFNGKDLSNWTGDPKLWSVENGEIVGRSVEGLKHNQFLFSDMVTGDFRLTVKVKLVGNQGNSGIQFRSEALPGGEAKGYQADVGPGWWGKLYEENGRTLLVKEGGEQWVKPGEWNDYEVVAVGSRIRTTINGHTCVDIDDPKGAMRGQTAFQLHSGGPTEVRFKDLKLDVDPPAPGPAGK